MTPSGQQSFHVTRWHHDHRETRNFGQTLMLAILILATTTTGATAGSFPQERIYDNHQLILQGEGRANYLLWDIYDAALYLPRGTGPDAILAPSTTRCLVIHYLRDIQASDLRESSEQILKRQLSKQQWQTLSPKIKALNDHYQNVRPGDHYRLCYAPKRGTSLYFNNQKIITIPGSQFAKAYFGIWLDMQHPISPKLRGALTGGSQGG